MFMFDEDESVKDEGVLAPEVAEDAFEAEDDDAEEEEAEAGFDEFGAPREEE